MKKYLYLLFLIPSFLYADSKVTDLNEQFSPSTTDYMYIVSNANSMKVTPQSLLALPGSSTSYLSISSAISTYLQLSSATGTYLQLSSATATYLQLSSAVGTYLQLSSATATYLQISSAVGTYLQLSSATGTYLQLSSATGTYLQLSSAIATYLSLSSATATYLQNSSATATYLNKNSNYVGSVATNGSMTGGASAAPNVAISLAVNPSSGTLQGNNFNTGSQLVQLSGGLIPNSLLDVSSITKSGVLVAGSNITLTPGAGITTIAASASGGSGGTFLSSFTYTFLPAQAKLPGVGSAITNSTNATTASVLFDDVSTETVTWSTILENYNGSTLKADISYTMLSASSGTLNLGVYLMCVTSGDAADVDTASFGTINSTSTTVPGTAGYMLTASVNLTNGDSCAANDLFIVKLERTAGLLDTAVGDAEFRGMRIWE